MKVVETFEVVRKFLGWSYQEVSVKLGKYSPEYLRQVHQGRPFPGVEKDLILTYIRGLAERVVYLVFGDQIASVLREKLVTKFTLLIQQSKLSLSDVRALVEMISNDQVLMARIEHRTETMDAVGVEIDWEGTLQDAIRRLDMSKQGTLFPAKDEIAVGNTHLSLVSDSPAVSRQPNRDYQVGLDVCDYCRKPLAKNQGIRHTCGFTNVTYS